MIRTWTTAHQYDKHFYFGLPCHQIDSSFSLSCLYSTMEARAKSELVSLNYSFIHTHVQRRFVYHKCLWNKFLIKNSESLFMHDSMNFQLENPSIIDPERYKNWWASQVSLNDSTFYNCTLTATFQFWLTSSSGWLFLMFYLSVADTDCGDKSELDDRYVSSSETTILLLTFVCSDKWIQFRNHFYNTSSSKSTFFFQQTQIRIQVLSLCGPQVGY